MSEIALARHVGYVVDGNRRWAKTHGLPTYEGHLAGYNALHEVVTATFDAGVEFVSAYIFSTENWKRTEDEVSKLMGLVLRMLTSDLHMFDDNNIKLTVIGSREHVSEKILKAIDAAEERTKHNTRGTLVICFNYGGQQEIADAVSRMYMANEPLNKVTPAQIEQYMYAPEVPALDLIVRTSGEQRLSNFMLWRAAYSEFIYLDKPWPDMTKDDVVAILEEYSRRGRRFGG